MTNKILSRNLIGIILAFAGASLSIYFDGGTSLSSSLEKLGYLIFFSGAVIVTSTRHEIKKENKS